MVALKTILLVMMVAFINIAAATVNSSEFHGIPSYSIFTYTSNIVANQGDNVKIELYISGAGDVDAKKLSFHPPTDLIEGNVTVNYYNVTNFENEKPIVYPIEGGVFYWDIPKEFFTFDEYWANDPNGALINFGEEPHGNVAPITLNFKVNKSAPAGDQQISIILVYKNGTQWLQSEKELTIHVRYFYEKLSYQAIFAILGFFSAILSEEIISSIKFGRNWIRRKLKYRYGKYGIILAVVSLMLFPPIFGILSIFCGYKVYKRDSEDEGKGIMVLGAIFMIIGMIIGTIIGSIFQ